MKVAVVGAGSTYTPELVSGLSAQGERLDVTELHLHDVDAGRLEVVGGLAARMLDRQGYGGELVLTGDLDRAVEGADAVLIQIRVGGQAARLSDETVPLQCGCIGQETTGAGGLAKALRTVPVVLDIAERVRELAAPDAWIVDFTNPVGIVTRALLDAGHRAVGLCNVAIGFQRWFAELLAVTPEEVTLGHVGLNHLTWERSVMVGGRDVLPELVEKYAAEIADRVEQPEWLIRQRGVVPSYYLNYFYNHDREVAAACGAQSRGARVAEMEAQLLTMYADPAVDEKPALLGERGGAFYSEAAINLLASLTAARGDVQVVNLR
ncbi:MAG: 6-phospho-beta-glucosidase, partial [Solirubrobacteraceae bacterium]|nr:6-phospho-beta-glucosidase [Solirubrobacteraceae bacterium]